jgi:hypothetical protein
LVHGLWLLWLGGLKVTGASWFVGWLLGGAFLLRVDKECLAKPDMLVPSQVALGMHGHVLLLRIAGGLRAKVPCNSVACLDSLAP